VADDLVQGRFGRSARRRELQNIWSRGGQELAAGGFMRSDQRLHFGAQFGIHPTG